MAYTRINWQDGESGGTPLSAENLNKMDMQIEQNTNAIEQNTSDIDDLVQAEVYSTSEVKTNKKWIDGKPIYRKVIQYSNRILAGNVEIPHGIHNFKMLAKIEIITFYDNKYYATPLIYNNVSNASYINYVDTSNIVLKLGENWDLYNMNIILEYTKTTD